MKKLIKNWDELEKATSSKGYKILLNEEHRSAAWIVPIEETLETKEHYFVHHVYLSTHTFYGNHYEGSTKLLQNYGFDVEIDNWDKWK